MAESFVTTLDDEPVKGRATKRWVSPLVPVASAFAAGILIDRSLGMLSTTREWSALAVSFAMLGLLATRWEHVGRWAILGAILSLGAARHHAFWTDLRPDDLARASLDLSSRQGEPAWLRGVLVDIPELRKLEWPSPRLLTTTTLDVTDISDGQRWHAAAGRIRLTINGDRSDLMMGQPVQAAGQLRTIEGPLNPGEFDMRLPLRARKVRLRLSVGEPEGVWPDTAGHTRWQPWLLGQARVMSYQKLVEPLDPAIAPLAAALLLGRREGVDSTVEDAFARTGTLHLLAISGLHLQVLAGGIWGACTFLGLGLRRAAMVTLVVVLLYALLVGLEPSVVRSTAMTGTLAIGILVSRSTSACPANLLALALLVTLVLNPAHLFDVGCQLSFLAVATLIWGVSPVLRWAHREAPRPMLGLGRGFLLIGFDDPANPLDQLERRLENGWRKRVRHAGRLVFDSLVVSLLISLVTAPLVASRFHVVAPINLLLNLPLVPITSLALGLGAVSLLMSTLSPMMAHAIAAVCGGLLEVTQRVVLWGGRVPGGHFFTAGPPGWWVAGFYALLIALVVSRTWAGQPGKRAAVGLGVWLLLGLGMASRVPPFAPVARSLEAEVLAVGHGLSVVVRTPGGRTILYDCGKQGDTQVGRRIIAPALWAGGSRAIDTVILSHADSDHYNGLADLVERFHIGRVGLPPDFGEGEGPDSSTGRLLAGLKARGVEVFTLKDAQMLDDGENLVSVFHVPAPGQPQTPDNERSAVIAVGPPGRRLLLTGDLEGQGQAEMLAVPSVEGWAALLSPHHGSRAANPAALYDWAKPRDVVVSQEAKSPATTDPLGFLAASGITVYRTWERGALRLRWERDGIQVSGFLDSPPPRRGSTSVPFQQKAAMLPTAMLSGFEGRWPRLLMGALGVAAGIGLCGLLAAIEWGAWALTRPRRAVKRPEPEPAPWRPCEIEAEDGARLQGAFHETPDAEGKTLVLLHGFAEDRSAMLGRAQFLISKGWNVLLIDSRGRGDSGGGFTTFGARESGDLRRWLDWIEQRVTTAGKAQTGVIVWGRSMGATIALRAAVEDQRIRALVLEAPYADLRHSVAIWLSKAGLPGKLSGVILWRASRLAGARLDRPRPQEMAASLRCPALIVHGALDRIAPSSEVQRLAQAFPNLPQVIEVEGARHTDVFDQGGENLQHEIADFAEAATPKLARSSSSCRSPEAT